MKSIYNLLAFFFLTYCIGCSPTDVRETFDRSQNYLPELEAAPNEYTFKRGINISHWLSQNIQGRPYGANWFAEEDVRWLAEQGFDHLRIPIDAKHWMHDDGSLMVEAVEPFDKACGWAQTHGMGVILDMHTVPGANFSSKDRQSSLYTDTILRKKVADFWAAIAARYSEAGPWLRFELLNEPVADKHEQLNPVMHQFLAAVRLTNPTRVVYLTTNKWSHFNNVRYLDLPQDPNVALTVHFYDPFPFTHQRTDWTNYDKTMPQVDFPGIMPDLSAFVPAGHSHLRFSGQPISPELSIDPAFQKLSDWHKKNAPALEVHIGEFGAFHTAKPESVRDYNAAVVAAAERHGFSWAVWDYNGGFGIRELNGRSTSALDGVQAGWQGDGQTGD